jgi:hypothetical protein
MQIQMGLSVGNERIFRVARNSNTATATITAASFSRGAPAVLATASASVNGYDIVQGDTKGQPVNNLLIGVVYDYPDGATANVWHPEDVGLVQCYGLADVFMNIATKTDTLAGGILLVPNTGSAFCTVGRPVVELAGTATVATNLSGLSGGVAGLVVLAQTLASQASETFTAKAFVRCM